MAAQDGDRQPFLGLNEEEEKVVKTIAMKTLTSAFVYPITCVKTLVQLGHEPFPLSTGKTLIVAGRNAYFLPNMFSYALQLGKQRGYKVLFTGIDSAIVSMVVNAYSTYTVSKYIDQHYPEIGGKAEDETSLEQHIDHHTSFKRHLRHAIRDSVVRVASTVVSRPFTVVMVRQIAQLIGNESKYGNLICGLRTIGVEEGPAGLFSGLVPQLIGELLIVWGVHSLSYAAERALVTAGMYEDSKTEKELADVRGFTHMAIPFVINSFGYPYSVTSTVMAVAGSGLAVSFLPFSPSFANWQSAWDYLHPHGLKRGARMFLREQTGAVSVGTDQQLYASNKYFL